METVFTRRPDPKENPSGEDWQPRRNADGWYVLGWGRTSKGAKRKENLMAVASAEMAVRLLLRGDHLMHFTRTTGGPRVVLNADAVLLNGKSVRELRHLVAEYNKAKSLKQ